MPPKGAVKGVVKGASCVSTSFVRVDVVPADVRRARQDSVLGRPTGSAKSWWLRNWPVARPQSFERST